MSSIILLLLLLFVNGILTGPGTIELPDFFWSGRPVQEVLKKCAQKTGYIVKNPNSYREAYCLEKPEEEACFTKCILEETQLVLKEVVYIEEGIKNIANNKRWSPYDNRLEGARNLLKECTKQYKYNLNDIACVREEEFAHCLFLKHYLYPNIDDFFCKKMVDIPVSLNSLVEIANTRHCPLWLTKPGDIFCVNEVLDGDECLAYCIFVQAKILHDERQKIGMVDIFFKANRPFQRDHVIQVQTDLLLTRCWTLMLKQRKKWCQRSVYLKDCIKKYHKTYKFGSADCETNMTKELIMVAIMPNQLKAQDVFDSCYEIHKVQFIRLREIFKEDLSKCEVIMCALQGLEFARMNKEINTAKIMNNLIDMHFIKSNSITYNKIKKLLSICTRPIDQCIDAMLVLKCIRENALQYGLKNNTLEYNPFFIPHMYDIFQITDNIFDILKTCKSSDNRTLVRPGDLYNIQGTEYKEIRLCLLKQMNIFHKNGSLNLEVTLKTIKQRRIYRPKLPREIRFLQLKALVKNCANKRDYDETYYCLVKRRLEYGFEEYMSYPPFLKMSLPLRFFVNDSINVDDCYNKTGHKLYYPSDIFAFSASHEINVAGLSQCIIEKQEYWPIPEDGFKEVYLDSLVSRKIMTYEEMTLVRSIMMVCKANFNVTCLKKKSNRFGFDPEIEFDPFLKLNLTLSDLLSFRKDDEEVLSVCKTDTLSSSRDIFNVNDDPDLIHCIFENHDLFDNQGFNIERILKSLVDNGKAIRNSAVYNQIKAMLLICKANTSTEVKDCLVKNNDRFGLIPIVNFNPNFKIGLGLTDLLIKNIENKTLEHCRTLTKFPLRNFMDVFNIKKPEEEPYLECLLIRFGILKNKKLDVKGILERVNMTKNTTKHMNLQSFLEKCQNFTTGAYQIRNCFMENYLRFGFYKYPDFDAQLQLNKSFDDMMTGNKMAILKKCQSGIGLYKIIDIFNLDTVKFKHIIECVFRETLMINNRMIDPNAILKSLYGAHYKPHSPEAIQIRTFLKLCCPLPLNTGKMIKCFKENGERFGFKKLLEFYPDVKYINHISSYLGLNEKVNKSDKCYQESGLELQLAVDIFAIENYTDPIKKTLMDCILKAYDVTKGDRLNVKALLDLNRKEIKDKHWTNLKTLIYYCNNKTDIIKCLREDAMRFGFAKVIDFDPFLKTNLSLADFLNPKKNDKYIVEICNQKERLVASKDIFNLKGSELLVNCIFDNYNIFTKNKLNIDGILKMFVDNEKVKENDEIYKQIKAFLRMCDSRFPINVRDCLRSNNLRFGFKKFTQFNPLLHLGISLNDLLKEKEHESVNECQKLSDSPIKNIYDVFNTKSNTEEKYIECLLTYFNIMIDSKLAIDGILARQNWTEKDEEYKNMKSFLEECNQFTKAIEIKECFLQNYLRFGFDQLPDFDPQLKFEQNLGDFMIIHDKEEILTTCSDNNTRPIFEIVDVFNLNTTKYPIFIKCVLENTKIIANNTLDMETMLKSIFRNKPVLSSSIEMTQMRTFLKTCNKKPLLLAKLIICLKENGERFGLQPLLEFEPDLKFDDTISVYLGITPFHIDNKRCYKESKLELQKPEDIFSIERYTDESIRELIRCLFKNYEVIDDELINVEAILKWNKKNLSKKLQNKLKVFLNLCNNTVEPIICLQAYRERFNFKPAMDFDPFLKLDIELEDFLDSNTDEKEILQSCKNSVLGTSKDIFNVRNKTDLVKCIFEKHKIFDREDGLKVDNILKTLMKHEKIETNSKSYRQINTLLQLCSLKTADEVRQCLIENNNRFGLLKRLSFDPSIKVTLQLTDFLNPVENVTGCQSMVYDPIYDPKDVFSIKHNVDDAYIYCLFTHFNIMKNSQLQIKAILDHLNLSETDKQYNNIKSLLNECEEYSGPIDLKNCFVKNYLRFGFSKLPDFDPQFKINKDLDVLMIGNKKRILEKCTKGSERILFKAIDVFNLNMTKYPEMLTMATCILQESKILTRNGNLNINEMLLNAFGPKSNQNTGYYTNANSFLNTCNGNGMNNVTTEEIITCFRKNVRRFGFNPLINFDPLLKFNKTLAPILGVKKHIHNITMCFKQSQLKLHNAVDIFVIEEHLLSNTKALITCVLVKNQVLRQNPLEIEKILMKNRDNLSEEHFGQLKAFLHLCNVDDDIMGCMKENLERFGFEREIQFDPFLKMNISLIDFFRVNTDEEKILKICNAEELLKKTEDIYNYEENDENNKVLQCIFEEHGIVGKNGINIATILQKLIKHNKIKDNDRSFLQIRAFLQTCDSTDVLEVKKCFLKNRERFGFEVLALFNPKMTMDISLAETLKNNDISDEEVWEKCKNKSRGQKFISFDDIFSINNPLTLSMESELIECILQQHGIMKNDKSLDKDEILRRFATKFNDTKLLNQSRAILDLCSGKTGINLFLCLRDNNDRLGFRKVLAFDPLKKLPINLEDIMIGSTKEKQDILELCFNETGIKLLKNSDIFNVKDNEKLDDCIFKNHKMILDGKLNKDGILKHLKNKYNFDNQTLTHIKTLLEICEEQMTDIKMCLKQNSDRFGFEAIDEFDPLFKSNFSISSLLDDKESFQECKSKSGIQISSLKDTFSLNATKESAYLACILKKTRLLNRNGLLDINDVLNRIAIDQNLSPSDPLYKQIEAFLESCEKFRITEEIMKCLVANNDRFGFEKIRNFDPVQSTGMELSDLFIPMDNETEILNYCSQNVELPIRNPVDIFNLPRGYNDEYVECILEKYKFGNPEEILKSITDRLKLNSDDVGYKNTKAIFEECQTESLKDKRDCLITNLNRFGFKRGPVFDPLLEMGFSLTDFLDHDANTENCQIRFNSLLYDTKDVFLLTSDNHRFYAECVLSKYGLLDNMQLWVDNALNNLRKNTKTLNGDKQHGQAKELLEMCRKKSTDVMEIIECLRNNSLRFGLKPIDVFDYNLKSDLSLGRLLGLEDLSDELILKKCNNFGVTLRKVVDVINIDIKSSKEIVDCIFEKTDLTKDERLNIEKILGNVKKKQNIEETDSEYKQIKILLNICDDPDLGNSLICLKKNIQRFGFKEGIKLNPKLQMLMPLYNLIPPRDNEGAVLKGCYSKTGLKLHLIIDVMRIDQMECNKQENCKTFLQCILKDLSIFNTMGNLDIELILYYIEMALKVPRDKEKYIQIKNLLELCQLEKNREDILYCLTSNGPRFGFKIESFFDPLMTFNYSIDTLLYRQTEDKRHCPLIVSRTLELSLTEPSDVFMIDTNKYPGSEDMIKCIFKKYHMWSGEYLDAQTIVDTVMDSMNLKVSENDKRFKQVLTYLSLCREAYNVSFTKDCLVNNAARFGFKPLHNFDPLMRINATLAVFLKPGAASSCYPSKSYKDEDIFRLDRELIDNEKQIADCVLRKQDIIKFDKLNKYEILQRTSRNNRQLTEEQKDQISSFLDLCIDEPENIYYCFVKNAKRFGFRELQKFDPFTKTNFSLSDLFLKNYTRNSFILQKCGEIHNIYIYEPVDIFLVDPDKCPETKDNCKKLIGCIYKMLELADQDGLKIKEILSRIDPQYHDFADQISSMLTLCDLKKIDKTHECIVNNYERYGISPIIKFDPFATLGLSMADLMIYSDRKILQKECNSSNSIELYDLNDVFNIDIKQYPEMREFVNCIMKKSGLVANGHFKIKEILNKHPEQSKTIELMLKICETEGSNDLATCLKRNNNRFGFNKLIDFDPKMRHYNDLSGIFDNSLTEDTKQQCNIKKGYHLQYIGDVFSIKNRDGSNERKLINCVFRVNNLLGNHASAMRNLVKNLPTETPKLNLKQMRTFLEYCSKREEINAVYDCLADEHSRFGFNKHLDFDPLLEMNITLLNLMDDLETEHNVLTKCLTNTAFTSSLVVFNDKSINNREDLHCIWSQKNFIGSNNRLNINGILNHLTKHHQLGEKELSQVKAFLESCNFEDVISLRKYLLNNAYRFGFKKFKNEDFYPDVKISLSKVFDLDKDHDVVAEICCEKLNIKYDSTFDIFNPETWVNIESVEKLVYCILENRGFIKNGVLDVDAIIAKNNNSSLSPLELDILKKFMNNCLDDSSRVRGDKYKKVVTTFTCIIDNREKNGIKSSTKRKMDDDDYVLYHNKIRGQAQRTYGITNMLMLKKDEELETEALELAKACDNTVTESPSMVALVQNKQMSWKQIFDTEFQASAASFQYGKEIGTNFNYVNIVWATNSHVGCQMHQCPNSVYLYVCLYKPTILTADLVRHAAYPFEIGTLNAQCPNKIDKTLQLCTNPCEFYDTSLLCNMEICSSSDMFKCQATCKCPKDTIFYRNRLIKDDLVSAFVTDLNRLRIKVRNEFPAKSLYALNVDQSLRSNAESFIKSCPKLDSEIHWYLEFDNQITMNSYFSENSMNLIQDFQKSVQNELFINYFTAQLFNLHSFKIGCGYEKCNQKWTIFCNFKPAVTANSMKIFKENLELPCLMYTSADGSTCMDYCIGNEQSIEECKNVKKITEPEYVKEANKIRQMIQKKFSIMNMLKLSFDEQLEKNAKELARNCQDDFKNLQFGIGLKLRNSLEWSEVFSDHVNKEGNEFKYGIKKGSSSYNFINLVWATSFKIGCAKQTCQHSVVYICLLYPPPAHNYSEILALRPFEIGNVNELCHKPEMVDQETKLCINMCPFYNKDEKCGLNGPNWNCDNCKASCRCENNTIFYENKFVFDDFTTDIAKKLNAFRSSQSNHQNLAHLSADNNLNTIATERLKSCPKNWNTDKEFIVESNTIDFNLEKVQHLFQQHYKIGCAVRKCDMKFILYCEFGDVMTTEKCSLSTHNETQLCIDYCKQVTDLPECKANVVFIVEPEYVKVANEYRKQLTLRFNITNMLKLTYREDLVTEALHIAKKCLDTEKGIGLTLNLNTRKQWQPYFEHFKYKETSFPHDITEPLTEKKATMWWAASYMIGCRTVRCRAKKDSQPYFNHACVLKPERVPGAMPFEMGSSRGSISSKCRNKRDSQYGLCLNSCPYTDKWLLCGRIKNPPCEMCEATCKCPKDTIASKSFDVNMDLSIRLASLMNIERSVIMKRMELISLRYVVFSKKITHELENTYDNCNVPLPQNELQLPVDVQEFKLMDRNDILLYYQNNEYLKRQMLYHKTYQIGCILNTCGSTKKIHCKFDPTAPKAFELNYNDFCTTYVDNSTQLCLWCCSYSGDDEFIKKFCQPIKKYGVEIKTAPTTTVRPEHRGLSESQRQSILSNEMFDEMEKQLNPNDVAKPFNILRGKIYKHFPSIVMNHLSTSRPRAFSIFVFYGRHCDPTVVSIKNGFLAFHEDREYNIYEILDKYYPIEKVIKELPTTQDVRLLHIINRRAKTIGCMVTNKCYPYAFSLICHIGPSYPTQMGPVELCKKTQHVETKLCLDYCDRTDNYFESRMCQFDNVTYNFCINPNTEHYCRFSCSCRYFREKYMYKPFYQDQNMDYLSIENFGFATTTDYAYKSEDLNKFFSKNKYT